MDTINGIVRNILFDVILKVVISRAVAAVPFLGFPVIGPLFGMFAGWLAGMLYEEMAKQVTFAMIDLQVGNQKEEYEKAVEELKVVMDKPKEEQNAEELEKAKEALRKRLADLVVLKPR